MNYVLLALVLIAPASRPTFADSQSECRIEFAAEVDVAKVAAGAAEDGLRARGFGRRARGYALLVGAMVASAAATSYLTAHLPPGFQLLTQIITQVSYLGVFVFGAPIWEPLSSAVRKLAFGVEQTLGTAADPRHRAQWHRTQNTYGIIDQMGRNIPPAFLAAYRQNFYEARRAHRDGEPEFAAEQIAEAAVRLRQYYADVRPDDPTVADAVRTSFTRFTDVGPEFARDVRRRIARFDPRAEDPDPRAHYDRALAAWLGPSLTEGAP